MQIAHLRVIHSIYANSVLPNEITYHQKYCNYDAIRVYNHN